MMPVTFIAHGAPPLLDIPTWVHELHSWAEKMPKPKAILMISAHWEERPVTLGATTQVPLVYDFYGFPERYYQVKYPAPGAPQLASRIEQLIPNVTHEPTRGLDHGAYVPLIAMYPKADIPVLQMSMPSENPQELFELGLKLQPLRDEGVLICGSGFITHNLRAVDWSGQAATPAWARELDQWTHETLDKRDMDALMDYDRQAPGLKMALPTREHFVPLLVSAGAANNDKAAYPIDGFWMASLSRRSVQFG
jgi:4,5-DOPA dioxygenase extradiol